MSYSENTKNLQTEENNVHNQGFYETNDYKRSKLNNDLAEKHRLSPFAFYTGLPRDVAVNFIGKESLRPPKELDLSKSNKGGPSSTPNVKPNEVQRWQRVTPAYLP